MFMYTKSSYICEDLSFKWLPDSFIYKELISRIKMVEFISDRI